ATAKVKTVNEERQIQALLDKKKVIIMETSVRSDLHLKDVEDTECLPTAISFEQLKLMGEVEGMLKHKEIYVTPSHTKKIFANKKRVLTLETTKVDQALEIGSLKRRVKKLKKKANKKPYKLKRLYKIGSSTRVESSKDANLGDQEDTSKQGRMIAETQEMKELHCTADLVPTTGEVVTTASVEVSSAAITP
nr:hypothetical protein [Tanacetum cinerariifolium]